MNKTTHRLLSALAAGSDEHLDEFSDRVRLPPDSIHDRIGSLEQKGIIHGYEVDSEPEQKLVEAWAFFKRIPGGDRSLAPLKHKFVRAAYEGPGRYSLMLRLAGPDVVTMTRFASSGFHNSGFKLVRVHQIERSPTALGLIS